MSKGAPKPARARSMTRDEKRAMERKTSALDKKLSASLKGRKRKFNIPSEAEQNRFTNDQISALCRHSFACGMHLAIKIRIADGEEKAAQEARRMSHAALSDLAAACARTRLTGG